MLTPFGSTPTTTLLVILITLTTLIINGLLLASQRRRGTHKNKKVGQITIVSFLLFFSGIFLVLEYQLPISDNLPYSSIKTKSVPQTISTHPGFEVLKVIDGDTIDIDLEGKKTRVRIIGINTPETNTYECYGEEAAEEALKFFENKKVILEGDSTQQDQDRYGRLLRFVFVEGTDFGLHMLREGFAREYTYNRPYKYSSSYKEAQTKARRLGLGLWGSSCLQNK